jgi:hypothetical protein
MCAAAGRDRRPRPSEVHAQVHLRPVAGRRHQQCGSSNQVTNSPPRRRRRPHRAARPATSWSPRPPSASRPAGRSSGVPGPARSVTSTRTTPSPAMTATVTVSPGAPEPECRTLLPKTSLTSKTATSPHGCPGPSTTETKERAARARSARPASVTLSRTVSPAITAPALPGRPIPGNQPGSGRTQGHARSTPLCTSSRHTGLRGPCPWLVRGRGPRPWPSVKKPTVHTDRPDGTDARPLCVRGHRNMTVYSDTR